MQNINPNQQVVTLLSPVAKSATFTTNWVDRQGFGGTVALMAHIGADTGTLDGSNYYTVTYQESGEKTSVSATAVAAADMLSTLPVLNAKATYENTTQLAEYRGNKRYFRAVFTETGAVNFILGLTALLNRPVNAPTGAAVAGTAAT